MASVSIENLTKEFHGVAALDKVSMEVDDGEFAVVLGPSGCGKTTLLRCIAGLEEQDSGHVSIGGEKVDDLPPRERDLAMVFQNYALFPHLTVKENIGFPLRVRRRPEAEVSNRIFEVAKFLGIDDLLSKRPSQLSGGEQQRVAMARALIREPKAFLMDEPLSNLDAPLRAYMRTELKRIQREFSITTIYVTHDQTEALSLATMMGVMYRGRLLQYDKPEKVYSRPANAFVAGFVGNPGANLVDATVDIEEGKAFLVTKAFRLPLTKDTARRAGPRPSEQFVTAIRPEDIAVSRARRDQMSVEAEVYSVEPMGTSTVLNLRLGEIDLKAIVPGEMPARADEHVWVDFDAAKVHIFEKQNGELIL